MSIRSLTLTTLLCLMAVWTQRGWSQTTSPNEATKMPSYVVVVDDEIDSPIQALPDSTFNRIAGRTTFRVNRTHLNSTDEFFRTLCDDVLPYARENRWTLVGIDLRGAASPEGTYRHNLDLAQRRAKALHNYLAATLDTMMTDNVTISTQPADYPYLIQILNERGDHDAARVAEILGKYSLDDPEALNAAIRKADGGRLWSRMLNAFFPEVRTASVVLFFRRIQKGVYEVMEIEAPMIQYDTALHLPDVFPQEPLWVERPHMLAVSTNLLYDAFYMPKYGWAPMPNVNVEIFPRTGKFTYRLQFMSPYYHVWGRHKFFQIRDYHFEVRRYFNPGKLHTGAYLAAYLNANVYGIGLNSKKGWQGEGLGLALKAGYVVPLGSGRWRIDFHIAAGGYWTRFDPYVYGNPVTGDIDGDYYYDWKGGISAFRRRNHQLMWFGPTELGVTISYDLLYWRLQHKGVSTHRKEVVER